MLDINSQLLFDQIPGYVGIKDINLKYAKVNQNLLSAMNFKNQEEVIGLGDHELSHNTPKMNDIFLKQDLLSLQGESFEVIHGPDDIHDDTTYFLQKRPFYNANKEIIGIIYHCNPWRQAYLLKNLQNIDKKYQSKSDIPDCYNLNIQNNPFELSNRELECLFLQLRGKTAKQISEILKLSKRTIEYYIENIKSKFGAQNKSELLLLAVKHCYQNFVPKNLLQLNLAEVLK